MEALFQSYVVLTEYHAQRIDQALASLAGMSRSHVQTLILKGEVLCNGSVVQKMNFKVAEHDTIKVADKTPLPSSIQPSNVSLDIVFEDESVLVINKPAGMVVHPAPGNYENTLVHAVIGHCQGIQSVGDCNRPGIVHRLDKDTSGLILIAKTNEAHDALSRQFQPVLEGAGEKKIHRVYWGFLWGQPPLEGTLTTKIARHHVDRKKMCVLDLQSQARRGKIAVTSYKVKKTWKHPKKETMISLVQFHLLTGRTHQIRVHSQFLKCPLIGDLTYGKRLTSSDRLWPSYVAAFPRQALHAKEITFLHPLTHQVLSFTSPLPGDMARLLQEVEQTEQQWKTFLI